MDGIALALDVELVQPTMVAIQMLANVKQAPFVPPKTYAADWDMNEGMILYSEKALDAPPTPSINQGEGTVIAGSLE